MNRAEELLAAVLGDSRAGLWPEEWGHRMVLYHCLYCDGRGTGNVEHEDDCPIRQAREFLFEVELR